MLFCPNPPPPIWVNQSIHSFTDGCLNPCLQGMSIRVFRPSPPPKMCANQPIHLFLDGCLNPCLQGMSVQAGCFALTHHLPPSIHPRNFFRLLKLLPCLNIYHWGCGKNMFLWFYCGYMLYIFIFGGPNWILVLDCLKKKFYTLHKDQFFYPPQWWMLWTCTPRGANSCHN